MRRVSFLAMIAVPLLCFGVTSVENMPPSGRPQSGQGVVDNFQIETSISEVYGNGKYLVMQDDSKWEVREKDQVKTGGWLGPADVRITKSNDPAYPYKILNKWTNSIVFAKPVEDVTDSENPQTIQ